MAEETAESESPKKDVKIDSPDFESHIQTAMHSRVAHFKEQADSLTFEGVRRLLEKDLGLDAYALDVHKRFIKHCLLKCLEGVEGDVTPKNSGEVEERGGSTQEGEGSTEERQSKKYVKEEKEKMEDSPVLGLLKEQKKVKHEIKEASGNGKKAVPSETIIKNAIRKRAAYIKANSEKVTMAGLRRLLEEDLKLDKFSLDSYKKLIGQQLDEVLKSSEVSKSVNNAKKIVKNKFDNKATKEVSSEDSSEEGSDESDQESDEEDDAKPRKRSVSKGKMQNSVGTKKRKGPPEETKSSSKKRIKPAKGASEDNTESANSEKESEDDQSRSLPEKSTKKKEVSTPAYGKHVEHLKSVIKACGMSVPPSIYKKVKQVSENKREAQLIRELEEILSREGLSSNPSEKEIKEVRRKKERAKELEGIDVSNIVSSSRRRSTASFVPPPKPKVPVESKGDDAEDGDDDEEDEEDEDNSDDGSQSEESNEDEEGSD